MKIACFFIAIALAGSAAAETPPPPPLAPMSFWAGHCFKGSFPGGQQTDEHCFAWVFEGSALRDRHVVKAPGKPDYIGETVYVWDSEKKKISYLYYENEGGVSSGTAEPTADGMTFPAAHYSAPGGEAMTYRVRWTKQGDRAYEAFSEAQNGDKWVPMVKMVLTAER